MRLARAAVQAVFTGRWDNPGMSRMLAALAMVLLLAPAGAQTLVADRPAQIVIARVLELVNQARSQGRRCGAELFPPAAPLAAAEPLEAAARAHARDMASGGFFDHRGSDGSQPRERVRAAGYRARLSGENIAFGPASAEEVVAGWLASPGHCANIMDARFRHTGVGFAEGPRPGHYYWVQTFGAPGG
jgi:uncharacterized protein YkwD